MLINMLLSTLLLAVGNGVLALGGVGLTRLTQWIGTKTHSTRAQAILDRVNQLVQVVVKDVYQSYAQPLKDAGKWNAVVAAQARSKALDSLRQYLGPKGLSEIAWLLNGDAGSSPMQALDKFLGSFIESAVHDLGQNVQTVDGLTGGVPGTPPVIQKDGSTNAGLPPFAAGIPAAVSNG